jgi:hypothetical protein
MNICDPKQKALAQRVYFDLKICRKWLKLHVYFNEIDKWIFFLGKISDEQPLTFVLPMSSDEQLTVDELFNLKTKLTSALKFDINENIPNVLMAIIANDFTLGYFNFSFGLPVMLTQSESSINPPKSPVDKEFTNEIQKEITNDDHWMTTDNWN